MDMNEWFALQQKTVATKIKKGVETAKRAQGGKNPDTTRAGLTATFDIMEVELFKLLNEVVTRRASYDDLVRFENNCLQYITQVFKNFDHELAACGDLSLKAEKDKRERELLLKLHNEINSQQKFAKSRTYKFFSDMFNKKK